MDSTFEAICARFWQLMTQEAFKQVDKKKHVRDKKDCIHFHEYSELLKRIYRVLVPLYREQEIQNEVAQEWIYDATGLNEMSLVLFQKMLFRIAH